MSNPPLPLTSEIQRQVRYPEHSMIAAAAAVELPIVVAEVAARIAAEFRHTAAADDLVGSLLLLRLLLPTAAEVAAAAAVGAVGTPPLDY